ncbi:MAG: CoA-binding protein, partial [Halieaceae bacterium]|nr:CoA-binding protein [Halieaceae bacterium]
MQTRALVPFLKRESLNGATPDPALARLLPVPITADRDIAQLLATTRTIAVVGASANPQRPSHRVLDFLIAAGYEVFPINPGIAGSAICGRTVYASLDDVPAPIDLVDVFRQPQYLSGIVDQAIAVGARAVWGQLGVVDEQAAVRAAASGLQVV